MLRIIWLYGLLLPVLNLQTVVWLFTRATRSIAWYMLRQRSWLAGCHSRYCVTTKPILKLFQPSGSPVLTHCADTQFLGEPLQLGREIHGGGVVGKCGDFQLNSPFTSEMVRDRPMVTMEH